MNFASLGASERFTLNIAASPRMDSLAWLSLWELCCIWMDFTQLAQWLVGSTTSNTPSVELNQDSRLTLMNSHLRNWIKLSFVSSRPELPLKLYDKINKDLFSHISSNQSYKTITVNLNTIVILAMRLVSTISLNQRRNEGDFLEGNCKNVLVKKWPEKA